MEKRSSLPKEILDKFPKDAIEYDVVVMMIQFLRQTNRLKSARRLEREYGIYLDKNYVEDLVIKGKFSKLESYFDEFTHLNECKESTKIYFEIWKQWICESLYNKDFTCVFHVYREKLRYFKNSPVHEHFTHLISLQDIKESSDLKDFEPAKYRKRMFKEISNLLSLHPRLKEKLTLPTTDDNIRELVEQSKMNGSRPRHYRQGSKANGNNSPADSTTTSPKPTQKESSTPSSAATTEPDTATPAGNDTVSPFRTPLSSKRRGRKKKVQPPQTPPANEGAPVEAPAEPPAETPVQAVVEMNNDYADEPSEMAVDKPTSPSREQEPEPTSETLPEQPPIDIDDTTEIPSTTESKEVQTESPEKPQRSPKSPKKSVKAKGKAPKEPKEPKEPSKEKEQSKEKEPSKESPKPVVESISRRRKKNIIPGAGVLSLSPSPNNATPPVSPAPPVVPPSPPTVAKEPEKAPPKRKGRPPKNKTPEKTREKSPEKPREKSPEPQPEEPMETSPIQPPQKRVSQEEQQVERDSVETTPSKRQKKNNKGSETPPQENRDNAIAPASPDVSVLSASNGASPTTTAVSVAPTTSVWRLEPTHKDMSIRVSMGKNGNSLASLSNDGEILMWKFKNDWSTQSAKEKKAIRIEERADFTNSNIIITNNQMFIVVYYGKTLNFYSISDFSRVLYGYALTNGQFWFCNDNGIPEPPERDRVGITCLTLARQDNNAFVFALEDKTIRTIHIFRPVISKVSYDGGKIIAMHLERERLITGDDQGRVTIWKVPIELEEDWSSNKRVEMNIYRHPFSVKQTYSHNSLGSVISLSVQSFFHLLLVVQQHYVYLVSTFNDKFEVIYDYKPPRGCTVTAAALAQHTIKTVASDKYKGFRVNAACELQKDDPVWVLDEDDEEFLRGRAQGAVCYPPIETIDTTPLAQLREGHFKDHLVFIALSNGEVVLVRKGVKVDSWQLQRGVHANYIAASLQKEEQCVAACSDGAVRIVDFPKIIE